MAQVCNVERLVVAPRIPVQNIRSDAERSVVARERIHVMMRSATLLGAANSINDRSSSRTVNIIIGALAALGLLMLLVSIWLWRASRPVPPHLEGLDLITKRRWLRSNTNRREHLLDTIREVRGPAPIPSLAREPEAIEPGPAMPISVDAASTSLGVASSPGVPTVTAAAVSPEKADGWLSPSLADAVPAGWIDQPVSPSAADALPPGWLDDPAPAPQPLTAAGLVPPPPAGPPVTDNGYGDPHE
jgi:hypothetical protein